MMRYWKGALVAIVFLPATWLVYVRCVPCLVVEDIDMGDCGGERFAYCSVSVENAGWARLAIDAIDVCCGTELPEEYPSYVPPKSARSILVKVRTRSNSTDTDFRRSITLRTNDPDAPVKRVAITGRDSAALAVTTNTNFGYIKPGYSSTLSFVAKSDEICMGSLYLTASSPYISIGKLRDNDSHEYICTLYFDESIPRGSVNEYVLVKTNVRERPYIVFPIHAVVERGIRVRPERILLRNDEASQEVKRIVRITVLDRDWRDIVRAECGHESVRLQLDRAGHDSYRLECSFDASSLVDGLQTSVVLGNRYGQELHIPVVRGLTVSGPERGPERVRPKLSTN